MSEKKITLESIEISVDKVLDDFDGVVSGIQNDFDSLVRYSENLADTYLMTEFIREILLKRLFG